MQANKDIKDIKNPLIIFYGENGGEWLSFWNKNPNKAYSDIFFSDDVKQTFTSIAFISEIKDEINYIASFRRDRIVATKKVRVFFDIVIKLNTPLTSNFILENVSKAMKNSIESVFNDKTTIKYLNGNQLKTIISFLFQLDNDNINKIKRLLFRDKKLETDNNKEYIISTERDALGLVFRINGLDKEINDIVNWNIEEMPTPDYINGLSMVNAREDQLIMKDLRCFGDWKVISDYVPSICTLSNGKKHISIMYANRTIIESNIGVDLIYFDHINRTYIFVQYKRLSGKNQENVYYPASDKNLNKEITLMERFETNLSKDQEDYRLNDQVFYFKFCKERQEVHTKELSSGFYLPKDYFMLINRLQKEKGDHISISYDTVTRYLTNTVFIELIQYGLIGTRVNDVDLISNIIKELLANKKSLILAATTPLR
jgi:hypothetical protein